MVVALLVFFCTELHMRRGVRAYLRRLSFERSSLAARPGLSAESAAGRGCSVAYDTRGLCKFFESRLLRALYTLGCWITPACLSCFPWVSESEGDRKLFKV